MRNRVLSWTIRGSVSSSNHLSWRRIGMARTEAKRISQRCKHLSHQTVAWSACCPTKGSPKVPITCSWRVQICLMASPSSFCSRLLNKVIETILYQMVLTSSAKSFREARWPLWFKRLRKVTIFATQRCANSSNTWRTCTGSRYSKWARTWIWEAPRQLSWIKQKSGRLRKGWRLKSWKDPRCQVLKRHIK